VNCHIVLLSQYCKKNGFICEKVDDYVSNRNHKLQNIIDTFGVSRKLAKDLILVMMYGGSINQYCCDNAFDITIPMPSWVNDLEKEMTLLTERISSSEASIFKDVSKLKKTRIQKQKIIVLVLCNTNH